VTQGSITETVRALIVQHVEWPSSRGPLGEDVPLIGDIVDSLEIVTLVSLIEEEFGIEIRSEDLTLDNFATIASIARFVETRRG
jgi:acyl carrier protein